MQQLKTGLRSVALAVLGVAVASAGVRAPEAGLDRGAVPGTPAYSPNPDRVALQVDGWIIEVERPDPDSATPEPPPAWRPTRSAGRAPVTVPKRPSVALSRYDPLIQWHASTHGLDW